MDFIAGGPQIMPPMRKRDPQKRVFVNRSLMMERVKFIGFDMDYTLAAYNSPEYETLGFDLVKMRLVEMGYPDDIKDFEYDPTFPIRGLWFDNQFGTLLKVDGFGNILVCVKGFRFLKAIGLRDNFLWRAPDAIIKVESAWKRSLRGISAISVGTPKGPITLPARNLHEVIGVQLVSGSAVSNGGNYGYLWSYNMSV